MKRRQLLGAIAGMPLAISGLAAPARAQSGRYVIDTRDGRKLDVCSWSPIVQSIGRIHFSHGFASAPRHYLPMISAWVAAGYEVHAPIHMDSHAHPGRTSLQGMDGWAGRIWDMRSLSGVHGDDHATIGHSYGGLTALTMGGAAAFRPEGVDGAMRDVRTVCALAFSPPGPIVPLIEEEGYGTIDVPAFVQTGTRDIPASTADDPQSWRTHLAAFTAGAAPGNRHGLVIEGVDHYFGGLICDPAKIGPNQAHELGVAIRASLAFLASYGPRGAGSVPTFASNAKARFYRR